MISKVTESNKNLIDARLQQINTALEAAGSSTRVDSLESYYANIIEISELTTDFHNAPYKFFLMPVDEPMFEIDANKRTIAVPTVFSKNGVGVFGDHKAEVLYFKIDKYFDYQDLFNVDEIIINWQFRPANASRNTTLETHTSIALAPDDTYDPGHIVFGWVITNEMTPSKGTLSFSVGFIKGAKNSQNEFTEYSYVLNTQVASVTINDSLALEDVTVLNSLKRPVFERLANSRYTPENITPLSDPVFRSGETLEDELGNAYKSGLPAIANFEMNNDGTEANTVLLTVLGYAPDDGNVQYTWHGVRYDGEDFAAPARATRESDYIKTADESPVDGIAYFAKVDNEYVLLTDSSEPTVEDAFEDDSIDVFELGHSLEVEAGGSYDVSIQSVKTIQQEGKADITARSGNVQSQACSIPAAAVPKAILSAQSALTPATNGFTIYDEEEAAGFTFISDTAPTVTAVISVDTDGIVEKDAEGNVIKVKEEFSEKGVSLNSSLGAIVLKVFKDGGEDTAAPTNFANLTYTKWEDGVSLPVTIANPTEGTYRVWAVNRRNHTYSVSLEPSDGIKLSTVAPLVSKINVTSENVDLIQNNVNVAPVNSELAQVVMHINNSGAVRNFDVTIKDTNIPEDEIVSVKLIETPAKEDRTDRQVTVNEQNYVVKASEEDENEYEAIKVEDVDTLTYRCEVTDRGRYAVQVITHHNGTERVSVTEPFFVVEV